MTRFILLTRGGWLGASEAVGEIVRCSLLVVVNSHGPIALQGREREGEVVKDLGCKKGRGKGGMDRGSGGSEGLRTW
jgi:hypothetical protein